MARKRKAEWKVDLEEFVKKINNNDLLEGTLEAYYDTGGDLGTDRHDAEYEVYKAELVRRLTASGFLAGEK